MALRCGLGFWLVGLQWKQMVTMVLKTKAVKLLIENNWTLLDGNYLGCLQIISCLWCRESKAETEWTGSAWSASNMGGAPQTTFSRGPKKEKRRGECAVARIVKTKHSITEQLMGLVCSEETEISATCREKWCCTYFWFSQPKIDPNEQAVFFEFRYLIF